MIFASLEQQTGGKTAKQNPLSRQNTNASTRTHARTHARTHTCPPHCRMESLAKNPGCNLWESNSHEAVRPGAFTKCSLFAKQVARSVSETNLPSDTWNRETLPANAVAQVMMVMSPYTSNTTVNYFMSLFTTCFHSPRLYDNASSTGFARYEHSDWNVPLQFGDTSDGTPLTNLEPTAPCTYGWQGRKAPLTSRQPERMCQARGQHRRRTVVGANSMITIIFGVVRRRSRKEYTTQQCSAVPQGITV